MELVSNPNERLVPVYEGDQLIYVTPPEYYARFSPHVMRAVARIATGLRMHEQEPGDTYTI